MSVLDQCSGRSFLVDSGADISVFPLTFLERGSVSLRPRPGQRLRAANGTYIDTFGTRTLQLSLQGFNISHSFRIARVAQPILGADFFRQHGILIDVKGSCLRLNDGLIVKGSTGHMSQASTFRPRRQTKAAVSALSDYSRILVQYDGVTEPKFDPGHVPAHGVSHVVPTTGSPVFARARPLFAEKLRVAKEEFDKMLAMQII